MVSPVGVLLLLSCLNLPSKVTRCFSSGFLCSFLCPLSLFFLNSYLSRPYFGVSGESPIDFLIGKCAVNVPAHHHSAILNDLLSCFFPALGNHLKNSIEDVLRPNSVNFLLHNLKIQPLIICIPLALHWITCDG